MSKNWPRALIAEIAAPTRNAVNGGPFGSKLGRKDYVQPGVPVIRGSNLPSEVRFRETDFVYVSEEKANELAAHVAMPGDIVVTQRGTLGQVGIVPVGGHSRFVISQSQMKLTVDPSRVNRDFIYYVLRSPLGQHLLTAHAISTGVPHINLEMFRGMEVPCPPLRLQEKCAAVLTAYDELIEKNLRRIEILEEMARAVYREWFVNFRFPGHEDVALVDSPLGPIPNGWKLSDLGASARWLSGGTPKTSEPSYWGGVVPWITSGSLTSFLLDRSDRTLTERGVEAGSRLVPRDTLLFVVRGMSLATEFRHGIAEVPLAFGQDCKALIAHPPVHPLYLAHNVSARAYEIQGMVEYAAHGTGKLSTDRLKALPVLHPPGFVQEAFVDLVAPMRRLMANLRDQVDNLRSTRDLLLPKLVSGEIDVSELEIETEWSAS